MDERDIIVHTDAIEFEFKGFHVFSDMLEDGQEALTIHFPEKQIALVAIATEHCQREDTLEQLVQLAQQVVQ